MKRTITAFLNFAFLVTLISSTESTRAETNSYNFGLVKIQVSRTDVKIDLPQETLAAIGHATTNYGGTSRNVAVSGNYAYVANSSDGLRIFDVSNPTNPVCVGHTTNHEYAQGIAISGNRVFLATDHGLHIYDISDPAQPVSANKKYAGEFAFGVAVAGNFAYLANQDAGFSICDVSDPANPVIVGQTNNGGTAYGVAVSDKYAYLANSQDGLRIYDVSNPAKPINIGHIEGYVLGVAVSTNLACLVGSGLQIYDVSNPANPVSLAQTNNGGTTISVAMSGKYAYVANQMSCVRIYDISSPAHPTYFANTTTNAGPSPSVGVAISGDKVYLANGKDGLRIYSH